MQDVERVAKALCAHEGEKWNAVSFNETLSGNDPEEMRESYRSQATAAISAMRADAALSTTILPPQQALGDEFNRAIFSDVEV